MRGPPTWRSTSASRSRTPGSRWTATRNTTCAESPTHLKTPNRSRPNPERRGRAPARFGRSRPRPQDPLHRHVDQRLEAVPAVSGRRGAARRGRVPYGLGPAGVLRGRDFTQESGDTARRVSGSSYGGTWARRQRRASEGLGGHTVRDPAGVEQLFRAPSSSTTAAAKDAVTSAGAPVAASTVTAAPITRFSGQIE